MKKNKRVVKRLSSAEARSGYPTGNVFDSGNCALCHRPAARQVSVLRGAGQLMVVDAGMSLEHSLGVGTGSITKFRAPGYFCELRVARDSIAALSLGVCARCLTKRKALVCMWLLAPFVLLLSGMALVYLYFVVTHSELPVLLAASAFCLVAAAATAIPVGRTIAWIAATGMFSGPELGRIKKDIDKAASVADTILLRRPPRNLVDELYFAWALGPTPEDMLKIGQTGNAGRTLSFSTAKVAAYLQDRCQEIALGKDTPHPYWP